MRVLSKNFRGSSIWLKYQVDFSSKRDLILLGFDINPFQSIVSSTVVSIDFTKTKAGWLDVLRALRLLSFLTKQRAVYKLFKSYDKDYSQVRVDIRGLKLSELLSLLFFILSFQDHSGTGLKSPKGYSWSFGLRDLASVLNLSKLPYDFYSWPFVLNVSVNFSDISFMSFFLNRFNFIK